VEKKHMIFGFTLLALALLPVISGKDQFYMVLVSNIMVMIILASAWNLLAHTGQASLGHAAFLGVGGYTSALLSLELGLPLYLGIPLAGAIASLVGLFVGVLVVRLREWFLAMVTFGVPVIIKTLTVTEIEPLSAPLLGGLVSSISSLQEKLGGHDGLFPPALAGGEVAKYYLIFGVMLASLAFIYGVFRSKWGFAFSAIRDNELEARVLGVNVVKYKLTSFVLSAFLGGVAGSLLAHHTMYINPGIYGIEYSFNAVIYSIVGGMGTVQGPVLGAVILSVLNEFLKTLGLTYLKNVIVGLIIVLTVLFLPRGLVSLKGEGLKSRLKFLGEFRK